MAGKKKARWKSTTKARGSCPSHCLGKVFTGYGAAFREARADSEGKCQAAGCHTPGGEPYACDCGHSTSYMMPN